jgi:hypothetical protein
MSKFLHSAAAAFLFTASIAYAHGEHPGHIDEGPGPGTWITVIMVVSWIVIAAGLVLFVRRLIRSRGPKKQDRGKQEKA